MSAAMSTTSRARSRQHCSRCSCPCSSLDMFHSKWSMPALGDCVVGGYRRPVSHPRSDRLLLVRGLFVKAQVTPVPIFPTKRAVVTGLYRINRNPMYRSVLAVLFGQALFYQTERVAWYGAFLFVCMHGFVIFYEEHDLGVRFNGEYEEFCRQVPRWLPRFKS